MKINSSLTPSILNLIDTAVVYEELNVEIKSLERFS